MWPWVTDGQCYSYWRVRWLFEKDFPVHFSNLFQRGGRLWIRICQVMIFEYFRVDCISLILLKHLDQDLINILVSVHLLMSLLLLTVSISQCRYCSLLGPFPSAARQVRSWFSKFRSGTNETLKISFELSEQ